MSQTLPAQHQERQPGLQSALKPQPQTENLAQRGLGKMRDRAVLITGGDSGIGRAVAVAMAKECADVSIVYFDEHEDAQETLRLVQEQGSDAIAIAGDVGNEAFCKRAVEQTAERFGRLDVLVNDAAEQHPQETVTAISEDQLERTFRTNVFSQVFMVKAAMPYLKEGASIVNIASVTAYEGNPTLIDYSSTKGAIVSFTRALSNSVVKNGIRVNAVAPGPIWTPLIPASYPEDRVKTFGKETPMGRPGQPAEVAAAVLFLASDDASYISGQTLHVNGGTVVNG